MLALVGTKKEREKISDGVVSACSAIIMLTAGAMTHTELNHYMRPAQ